MYTAQGWCFMGMSFSLCSVSPSMIHYHEQGIHWFGRAVSNFSSTPSSLDEARRIVQKSCAVCGGKKPGWIIFRFSGLTALHFRVFFFCFFSCVDKVLGRPHHSRDKACIACYNLKCCVTFHDIFWSPSLQHLFLLQVPLTWLSMKFLRWRSLIASIV